jgi:hypothetical protein
MKIFLFIFLACIIYSNVQAQPPGQHPKPPSVEEKIKKLDEVIFREVELNEAQKAAIGHAFKTFFSAEDQLRKENPPPPPPPPVPKLKAAMDKLVQERDESIKEILSEKQFEKYRTALEKLHPPKPGQDGRIPSPPNQ